MCSLYLDSGKDRLCFWKLYLSAEDLILFKSCAALSSSFMLDVHVNMFAIYSANVSIRIDINVDISFILGLIKAEN